MIKISLIVGRKIKEYLSTKDLDLTALSMQKGLQ